MGEHRRHFFGDATAVGCEPIGPLDQLTYLRRSRGTELGKASHLLGDHREEGCPPLLTDDFWNNLNSLTVVRALSHVQAIIAITRQMTDSPQERSPQEFVEQHLQSVWRYLRMHGAGPHEADDLAQEAFVTALQKGALNLDPLAAQVFLRRAARFAFLHHLRDRRRDPELADAVDDLWDKEATEDGGEQLLRDLHGCIDKLEGRAQQAIRWSYGIGVEAADSRGFGSREDVAKRMDLQPNGLKTLLQRTRQLLRTCIERATQ